MCLYILPWCIRQIFKRVQKEKHYNVIRFKRKITQNGGYVYNCNPNYSINYIGIFHNIYSKFLSIRSKK